MDKIMQKRILLVEDEVLIAIFKKNNIEKCGYEVVLAFSGEQAIDMISKNVIDLILMDIELGKGINGIDTAEKISKDKEIPIIFLSNQTDPKIIEKAKKVSSHGFIDKNSGMNLLESSMQKVFQLCDSQESMN